MLTVAPFTKTENINLSYKIDWVCAMLGTNFVFGA